MRSKVSPVSLVLFSFLAVLAAFFFMAAPVSAGTITSFKAESWQGNAHYSGGGNNGTVNYGGALERNVTYYFNVSGFSGSTFSTFRFRRYTNDSWGSNGNVSNYVRITVESSSNTSKQVTSSVAASDGYVQTGQAGNGSFMDLNVSVPITADFLLISIVPYNGSFVALYQNTGSPSSKEWATIEYDDSAVLPTGGGASASADAWLPMDGDAATSSVDKTELVARVSTVRGAAESFSVFTDSDGFRTAKSQVVSSAGNPQLFMAALLNKSGAVFPTNPIVFFQANDSFIVSAPLTKTYEAYGGGVFPVTWDRAFYSPSVAASTGGGTPILAGFAEFQTQGVTGGSPVDCYWWAEAKSFSTKYRFLSACTAPTGSVSGAVRVYLRNSTDNSTVATVFSGSGTFSDLTVNSATSYNLLFWLPNRENHSIAVGPAAIGNFPLTYFQTVDGTGNSQVNYNAGGSADAVAYFGPTLVTSVLTSSNASGTLIGTHTLQDSFATGSLKTTEYSDHFAGNSGIATTAATFSFASGALTKGMTHLVSPPTSASISYDCPSSVDVWPGVSVSVNCGNLTTNGFSLRSATPVTSDLWTDFSVSSLNGTLYLTQPIALAALSSLAVTDLSGVSIPSSFSGSSFSILRQSAVVNSTKAYKLVFTDVSGVSYTAYVSVKFVVGNAPTGTTGNGHRAIFVSNYESASSISLLPNVTVNVSGSLCTTALSNLTFSDNSTAYVARCDIWVPDSLTARNVTWSNPGNFSSVSNVFFGKYQGAGGFPLGVADGDTASIYYWTWNQPAGRAFVRLDSGDCLSPEVKRETADQNEYCAAQSCPVSSTVSDVGGTIVTPRDYVCASEGQSSCFTESNGFAWKAVCSSSCVVRTSACASGCNSDSSACSGDAPGSGSSSGALTRSVSNAFSFWGNWAGTNSTFIIALLVAILIFAVAAFSKSEKAMSFGGPIALFILVGGAILSLPNGLIIFIGVLLLCGVGAILLGLKGA